MSRRKRRARVASHGGKSSFALKATIAAIILCVVGAAVLYGSVKSYLRSAAFREFLAARVNKALKVEGTFAPFEWDGFAIDTPYFDAKGTPQGPIDTLRLEGIHTEVSLGSLQQGRWDIRSSRMRRLDVALDTTRPREKKSTPEPVVSSSKPKARKAPSWLPSEIALAGLDIEEVSLRAKLKQGECTLTRANLELEPTPAKGSYLVHLHGGELRTPFKKLPLIELENATLRTQKDLHSLTNFQATALENARLQATGDYDPHTRALTLQGDIAQVACDELFSETWAKRLTGTLRSDFILVQNPGTTTGYGTLTLDNGTLTALPILDSLAAYADTRRFRMLTLTEAHTRWRSANDTLTLNDLHISSAGLIQLTGNAIIRDGQIDGHFRLGLAPGTLSAIPGAETKVFQPGDNGLLWTSLHITGPLDDPKEDLTKRLITAAGLRMIEELPETGEKVIKYSHRVLKEVPEKTLQQGNKILEEGADALDDASDILRGILKH